MRCMRVVSVVLVAGACSKLPLSPGSDAPASGSGLQAGTVLSIVSAETGAPVAGASLNVGGRVIAGDAAGRVTLSERLDLGAPADVTAPGQLDRVTRLRSRDPITLWPKQSPTGLDEHFSATIVYTDTGTESPLANAGLFRLGAAAREVYVVPSQQLLEDGAAMDALQAAASRVMAAHGGQIRYLVAASAPTGSVRFDARLDPSAGSCSGARAFVQRNSRANEIVGGLINFCSAAAARSATATHEMGHSFGLRHSPNAQEVMGPIFSAARATDFGAREGLVMRLMLLRLPGNRSPDNDRDVALVPAALTTTQTIVCRE